MYNFNHENPNKDVLSFIFRGQIHKDMEKVLYLVIDKRMNGAYAEDKQWYLYMLTRSGNYHKRYQKKLVHRLVGYYGVSPYFRKYGRSIGEWIKYDGRGYLRSYIFKKSKRQVVNRSLKVKRR